MAEKYRIDRLWKGHAGSCATLEESTQGGVAKTCRAQNCAFELPSVFRLPAGVFYV